MTAGTPTWPLLLNLPHMAFPSRASSSKEPAQALPWLASVQVGSLPVCLEL